jgi:hypothetical protein
MEGIKISMAAFNMTSNFEITTFWSVIIYKLVAVWQLLEEPASCIFYIEMKAAGRSETFTSICQIIWPYIQNDFNCNFQCSETLKYYMLKFCLLDISNLYSFNGDTNVFKNMSCSDHIRMTVVRNVWCDIFVL